MNFSDITKFNIPANLDLDIATFIELINSQEIDAEEEQAKTDYICSVLNEANPELSQKETNKLFYSILSDKGI